MGSVQVRFFGSCGANQPRASLYGGKPRRRSSHAMTGPQRGAKIERPIHAIQNLLANCQARKADAGRNVTIRCKFPGEVIWKETKGAQIGPSRRREEAIPLPGVRWGLMPRTGWEEIHCICRYRPDEVSVCVEVGPPAICQRGTALTGRRYQAISATRVTRWIRFIATDQVLKRLANKRTVKSVISRVPGLIRRGHQLKLIHEPPDDLAHRAARMRSTRAR